MSKREDIASNIITTISTGTSPITIKKITRDIGQNINIRLLPPQLREGLSLF